MWCPAQGATGGWMMPGTVSSGFLRVSSHCLILPRVSSLVLWVSAPTPKAWSLLNPPHTGARKIVLKFQTQLWYFFKTVYSSFWFLFPNRGLQTLCRQVSFLASWAWWELSLEALSQLEETRSRVPGRWESVDSWPAYWFLRRQNCRRRENCSQHLLNVCYLSAAVLSTFRLSACL